MPNEVETQPEPLTQEVAQQVKVAVGAADAANARAMKVLRAQLKASTMQGTDGRMHGPLQPATILNFNPVQLQVGGQLNDIIREFDFPGSKTTWEFNRGGRVHRAHYRTFSDAKYYLGTAGHNENVDLHYCLPTLTPRYISPMEVVYHYWRNYSTESGDAQKMGGVLIIDGDIHELDETRLKKHGGRVWIPEAYAIPETRGELGFRLREASLADELEKIVELQVDYCNRICQRAYEYHNSKDEIQRKAVTTPMRKWGLFGVAMGYFKEKQPWMNENANASATADEIKTCPVCRSSSTDPDALMCGPCQAPYNADCTVECVKKGFPVGESYIDAMDPNSKQYRDVIALLKARAQRRRDRAELVDGKGKNKGEKQDEAGA